jgi:hypothetical protein
MDEVEREYQYKPKWWAILLTVAYFALGAVACAYEAIRNTAEVVRGFYWVASGLGVVLAALAVARAVERLRLRRRVALTPKCLLLPKRLWSSEEAAIEYRAITGLFISDGVYVPWTCRLPIDCQITSELPSRKVKRARFLYVIHAGGKQRIAAAELPSRAAFEEVCELVRARVRAA